MTDSDTRREQLALAQFTRSDTWDKVRRRFLKMNNECAVCGERKRLTAHHIIPFHIDPKLELDTENLITLCERHHISHGHLNRWVSWNPNVVEDAQIWREKILTRPKWRQMI